MSSGAHIPPRKLRVLLLEDSWHRARGLKSAFEMHGIRVIGPFARLGDAEASLQTTLPDMAVVAVNPKGEALPLIHHLIGEGVRVIALSTQPLPKVLRANGAAALAKPYTAEQLLAAVHGLIACSDVAH